MEILLNICNKSPAKGISLRNLVEISYFHTCQYLQEVSVARLAHLWDL